MLKGSIVALVTPFDKEGCINYAKLKQLIEFHISNKTDGLLILGTTAETPTLSELEKDSIVTFVLDSVAKRIPVIVGVCSNCTKTAIKQAKKYEKMGASYLLVISPYYNKSNPLGLYNHFLAIANSVCIDIVLYNIPSRTGINIDIETMKKLALIPNIIGVKEASYDINHILEVANMCSSEFALYSGNDDLNYLILALGGKGCISVFGNIFPKVLVTLCNLVDNGNYLQAKELWKKYQVFNKGLFSETNPIPVKTLLNEIGLEVGGFRLPLDIMDEVKKEKLLEAYRRLEDGC